MHKFASLVISGSMPSSVIMQLCNHASSLDSADIINETHWLQVRRFCTPVSISLITLQCARAEYELAKLAPLTKRLRSFRLTKTRIRRGGSPGQVENRSDFVLDFGDFRGSTRYRSKSVEGRPV
jgi:hypothetical protein